MALSFGPADYFSLMLLGLIISAVLAQGSVVKSIGMVVLGVALGLVGTDVQTGQQRFTFGIPELSDGISFVALAMGMFGIAEIILNLERPESRSVLKTKVGSLWLTKEEWKRATPSVLRGTALGSVLGILPGGGAALASFGSYMMERKVSKGRHLFGTGAIEGVAGPEAANNAAAQTSFIPLLTLGIPSNAVMALMVGALIIQGIQPGPRMVEAQPDLFWGLIASMWIGNVMLLVINLPMIGMWVKLLQVPYKFLYPAILVFCAIGAYSREQQRLRRLFDGDVRGVRLPLQQAEAGAGAAADRLRARPDDGGAPAPRHAAVARRPDGLRRSGRSAPSMLAIGAVALGAMLLPNLRKGKDAAAGRAADRRTASTPRSRRGSRPGEPGRLFFWATAPSRRLRPPATERPADGSATRRQGGAGHRRLGRHRPHHRPHAGGGGLPPGDPRPPPAAAGDAGRRTARRGRRRWSSSRT